MKLVFPNEQSVCTLIMNGLQIKNVHIIVLPCIPDKPILDLLFHHEIRVKCSYAPL